MYCDETNHLWLGRFAVRLMQLRQDMTLPSAVARAVKAHGYASDLGPERAAELDATASVCQSRSSLPAARR
jgi:hypothetical protein